MKSLHSKCVSLSVTLLQDILFCLIVCIVYVIRNNIKLIKGSKYFTKPKIFMKFMGLH